MKNKIDKFLVKTVRQIVETRFKMHDIYRDDDINLLEKGIMELQVKTMDDASFGLLVDLVKVVYDLDDVESVEKLLEIEKLVYDTIELEAIKAQEKEEEKEKGQDKND